MNRTLMQRISNITYTDAAQANQKRENANIDSNTAMGIMLQYGSEVSKYFCHREVLSPSFSEAHRNGDIHIHDLDFMNMGTLTCCQIDLLKLFKDGFSTGHGFLREPNDILSYAALAAIAIQSNQNDQHGGQSIPYFDYGLAEGVRKTFKKSYMKHLRQAIELLSEREARPLQVEFSDWIERLVDNSGYELKLEQADQYMNAELKQLTEELQLQEQIARKAQSFAYEEALAETEQKTYQAMEAFIHNLNTMHSRAGAQVPFSSINFGTDTSAEGRMVGRNLLLALERGLGNGETAIFPIVIFKVKEGVNYSSGDPNYDLFQLSCKVSAKRLFPNFSFIDASFNKKHYVAGRPETEVAYMGCRTRVLDNIAGDAVVTGRGNLSFTTINLPRLGLKHGIAVTRAHGASEPYKNVPANKKVDLVPDMKSFYQELDGQIDLVVSQLLERMKFQGSKKVKNFPFLMGQHVWNESERLSSEDQLTEVIKQGTLAIGFIGLAECLKALIGEHHGESEAAQQLGLQIISHMRNRMDKAASSYRLNFSLIATPAEGLAGRFTALDRNAYGLIEAVTDRDYYTNSFHIPVYYKLSVYEKITKEAPYHQLCNGGHISYVELDGDPSRNLQAFESIVCAMKEAGIGYGSINHPIDRDPICGYSGVIDGDRCPSCGRREEEGNIRFERIRRITGYLVGTLDRFNNAKLAEVDQRVRHI